MQTFTDLCHLSQKCVDGAEISFNALTVALLGMLTKGKVEHEGWGQMHFCRNCGTAVDIFFIGGGMTMMQMRLFCATVVLVSCNLCAEC